MSCCISFFVFQRKLSFGKVLGKYFREKKNLKCPFLDPFLDFKSFKSYKVPGLSFHGSRTLCLPRCMGTELQLIEFLSGTLLPTHKKLGTFYLLRPELMFVGSNPLGLGFCLFNLINELSDLLN